MMEKSEMMIDSEIYRSLSGSLKKAAEKIKQAIGEKRPILIRHHADCDGYSGAVALERAILGLLYEHHRRESDIFYYYRRSPSRAPYYDYSDATKDVSNFLADVMRHEHKRPLIIVVDNGSSAEDLMSLRKLRIYGAQVMVIDHHPPCPENDAFIDLHINPHFVTSSYALSAGMICAEISRLMMPDIEGMELLAALSGVSDKCQGKEIDAYLALAEKKGYTRKMIEDIAECLDFETYYLGFLESRYMVDDLFFGDITKQKELIAVISEEIAKRKSIQSEAVRRYAKITDMGSFALASLDIASASREGEYPRRGKIVGMALDRARSELKKPAVAYGYGEDFLTLRCDRELDVDLSRMIAGLRQQMPHALIEGGGHAKAGSISFVRAARDEVLRYVHGELAKAKYIKS